MPAPLPDADARQRALTDHGSTLLVEAAAGTGKTSLMAGRVAAMLARGIASENIAAITFTELAAAELSQKIAQYVDELIQDTIDPALAAAFPQGVDETSRANLRTAQAHLDAIVCTTIHGFCQALIRPYPVEAGIDPGARIMDPADVDITYRELFDRWLRTRFAEPEADSSADSGEDVLVEILQAWQAEAVDKIRDMADFLRDNRAASAEPVTLSPDDARPLIEAVNAFEAWYQGQELDEPGTAQVVAEFAHVRDTVRAQLDGGVTARGLVALAWPPRVASEMRKDAYTFKAFQRKGKWEAAASNVSRSKAEGSRAFDAAKAHFQACAEAYNSFFEQVSAALLHRFVPEFDGLLELYARHKRDAALLDFDDLILKARDLLKTHEAVRQDLQARFWHVLVDEFQDTDPVQCEILWWLAGDAPESDATGDDAWDRRRLNPGRLFLVGDPKQSVYRFRGADVASYLRAKQAIEADTPGNILAITTNFRSAPEILNWVNERFEAPFEAQQLIYAPLTSTAAPDNASRVTALDVPVEPREDGKITAEEMREAEAREVARLCQQLIDDFQVPDGDGGTRPCRAGDIALLAPTGTNLLVYERLLEERGVPIATQAGKGFFRRQEIQDLIALARTLADPRDTLALGALLRGPLVGMSEEQLLDIAGDLPRTDPARIPRLTLLTDPGDVPEDICRRTLESLQSLHRRARRTSPFELLADAVELLRVRPLLEQRHRGDAERALANVDLFLEMARPYAVRGLRAFATDMRRKWDESDRQAEGRPDAEADAVQVITMHAAKGLEWPAVIPINTMTGFRSQAKPLLRRLDGTVHVSLGAIPSRSQEALSEQEKTETYQERQRLWYVATTRPRELMVLPRLKSGPGKNCWQTIVDLDIAGLPALDTTGYREAPPGRAAPGSNAQTRESFAAEGQRIQALHRKLQWRQPSRHEPSVDGDGVDFEMPSLEADPATVAAFDDEIAQPVVLGGPSRGLVLHKLIEEILTGQVSEATDALSERADTLLGQLGETPANDPSQGYSPTEIARAALDALGQVTGLCDRLIPEIAVSASETHDDGVEVITAGTGDAITLAEDDPSRIDVVVDWKSDPDPSASRREGYREQVRAYVDTAGARRGLVVYASRGEVETVEPSRKPVTG